VETAVGGERVVWPWREGPWTWRAWRAFERRLEEGRPSSPFLVTVEWCETERWAHIGASPVTRASANRVDTYRWALPLPQQTALPDLRSPQVNS